MARPGRVQRRGAGHFLFDVRIRRIGEDRRNPDMVLKKLPPAQ